MSDLDVLGDPRGQAEVPGTIGRPLLFVPATEETTRRRKNVLLSKTPCLAEAKLVQVRPS